VKPRAAGLAVVLAALASAGCVPVAGRFYFPDPASTVAGDTNCTFAPRIPRGVRIERDGIVAIVSLVARGQGGEVEVRFDVPVGRVLALRGDRVRVDARDGTPAIDVTIPKVSEVDTPLHAYDAPALTKNLRPVDAPLEGRMRSGIALHYWIGGRFDGTAPDVAWVTLPPVTIDGRPDAFPAVRFERRFALTFVGDC